MIYDIRTMNKCDHSMQVVLVSPISLLHQRHPAHTRPVTGHTHLYQVHFTCDEVVLGVSSPPSMCSPTRALCATIVLGESPVWRNFSSPVHRIIRLVDYAFSNRASQDSSSPYRHQPKTPQCLHFALSALRGGLRSAKLQSRAKRRDLRYSDDV